MTKGRSGTGPTVGQKTTKRAGVFFLFVSLVWMGKGKLEQERNLGQGSRNRSAEGVIEPLPKKLNWLLTKTNHPLICSPSER
jgi:hypothetical protein